MSGIYGNFSIVNNIEFFLAGLAGQSRNLEQADLRSIKSQLQSYSTILSLQSRIRQTYDQYVPNIHVLDINEVTRLVVENIKSKLDVYIVFKNTTSSNKKIDKKEKTESLNRLFNQLSKENSSEYERLKNSIRSAILKHWRSVKIPGYNPIEKLNSLSKDLLDIQTNGNITDKQALQIGRNFAVKIDQVFGKRSVLGVYDKDLGSSSDIYIYFGKSFEVMRSSINEPISRAVKQEFLAILSRDIIENINVGFVVNFGHAMVITKNANIELSRYVNSPGFASAIYGVAKTGIANVEEAAAYYRDKSGLITNKVEFQKNFQEKSQYLMRLGLTVTFPEDWDINQTRGRKEEKPAKLSLVPPSARRKFRSKEQVEYIRYIVKLFRETVLTKNPERGSSSNTLNQFLTISMAALLKGEDIKPEKSIITKVKTVNVKQRSIVLNSAAKKQLKLQKPRTSKPKVQKSPSRPELAIPVSVSNLDLLLQKINSMIAQTVKQNMGTGTSNNLLNYRSGRFANSVKVEKLSESRQGTITAFYSYMKNPYATFSQGGRRQYPRSRDPKTLISKSIREIAQAMVTNQLRAVNV